MAADDEQALLEFLADLGDGDDPVDAADPDDQCKRARVE